MENSLRIACSQCNKIFYFSVDYFCVHCGFLNYVAQQEDENFNYFSYLGLPISFDINLEELENKHMRLMVFYHPDNFVKKTDVEKNNALLHSSYLNSAYNTLKDDMARIAYIYQILNNENIIKEEDLLDNKSFIMEFFDLYEKLELVNSLDSYKEFLSDIKLYKENIFLEIKSLSLRKDSTIVKKLYIKLKYLDRIKEKLLEKKSKIKAMP